VEVETKPSKSRVYFKSIEGSESFLNLKQAHKSKI